MDRLILNTNLQPHQMRPGSLERSPDSAYGSTLEDAGEKPGYHPRPLSTRMLANVTTWGGFGRVRHQQTHSATYAGPASSRISSQGTSPGLWSTNDSSAEDGLSENSRNTPSSELGHFDGTGRATGREGLFPTPSFMRGSDEPEDLQQQLAGQHIHLNGNGALHAVSQPLRGTGREDACTHLTKKRARISKPKRNESPGKGASNTSKRSRSSDSRPSFACPFAKRDRLRYQPCQRLTLKRYRDITQHLRRRHARPIYCNRCMQIFGAQEALEEHNRSQTQCEVQEDSLKPDGMTPQMDRELSKRRETKTLKDDTARWFHMYEILFPDDPYRPESALAEDSEDFAAFEEFLMTEGVRILATYMPASERHSRRFEETLAKGLHSVLSQWRKRGTFPREGAALISSPVDTLQGTSPATASTFTSEPPWPDFSFGSGLNDVVAVPNQQDLVPESDAVSLACRSLSSMPYADFPTAVDGYGARLAQGASFVPINAAQLAHLPVGGTRGVSAGLMMATPNYALDASLGTENWISHHGAGSSSRRA